MKSSYLIFILFLLHFGDIYAQERIKTENQTNFDSVYSEFSRFVYLDSIVISAKRNGFDVNDFIKMVMEDNSFYKAFKNLRFSEYDFENNLEFFSKKDDLKAKFKSISHQYYKNNCRWMNEKKIIVNKGIYKKNKQYKYYTSRLYDRLFYTHGILCNQDTSHLLNLNNKHARGMEKYVLELKKLIFSPGRKTNIPFIGRKMEIFSKKMRKYYNFSITSTYYQDSIPCYVFTASLKPNLTLSQADETVLKYLKTLFSRKNLQIIRREYHLKYKTIAYDFNVKMAIKLQKINEKYYPQNIKYDGTWHVLFKKRETCKFSTKIYNLIP